jgi:hypothetical protein
MRSRASSDTDGFVLPAVVFGLLLISTVAVAALLMADDEGRSSRAMHESSMAFYAAEAGLHLVYGYWDSIQAQIDSLVPGDSLVLPWRRLDNGSRYRARIARLDNGGQLLYGLSVEGRGQGARSGQRVLSFALTAPPAGPGTGYKLGACCDAAVSVRGDVELTDRVGVDGQDGVPFGWDSVCPPPGEDRPGLLMTDTTLLSMQDSSWLNGDPPLVQQAEMGPDVMDQFGDLSWAELKSLADIHIRDQDVRPRPSVTIDPETGELVCNTADPLNWGSPDRGHPCFDYFPIVLVEQTVRVYDGYGQGIFVLEWDPTRKQGSELDFEQNTIINGVVLGKGCIEVEENARFHGAVFVDGLYRNNDICTSDRDYASDDGDAITRWSQCAVDRAIVGAGLDEWAEPANPGPGVRAQLLGSHGFSELFR